MDIQDAYSSAMNKLVHELEEITEQVQDVEDLLSGKPLIASGRFKGKFPDIVKARGFLVDLSTHVIDVKVMKVKDMCLEMVNIITCTCLKIP
ncbi:hypothetical protein L1987_61159 [Smallanthus sonchifolius]|uniref:Uncharacterized protein n=1 Tax=Smallanthus sonchifolius TaxID=185202 RepID=A0ACB9DAF3_9ASTR|nr:hypothetical protein L1987_61159 [Smallanthus sonchifolius]